MTKTGLVCAHAAVLAVAVAVAPAAADDRGEIHGVRLPVKQGVTETVDEIMRRERLAVPDNRVRESKPEVEFRRPARPNPEAPDLSRWPPSETASAAPGPYLPQTVGTNFLAIELVTDSGFIPPDSIGAVGPTQVLVGANGRIKVFDKNGVLGPLNTSFNNFFISVGGSSGTSDPRIRYDRLSGRWFVTIITVATCPNHVLIAVSSGSTITGTGSFTFFSFDGETDAFVDYETLGIDANALYIGGNIFDVPQVNCPAPSAPVKTSGYVIRKSSLLTGTLSVTAFRNLQASGGTGIWTPQGVDNDDPAATEGYFIGVDFSFFSSLGIRRVINPGSATPTISAQMNVTVPTTVNPIPQVQPSGPNLDALDDRLFAAMAHKNKLTGTTTLWTAHNIEVNTSGVGTPGGLRNGSRWYEVGSLTTTPALAQSGTLFDPAGTTPFGFWIPSVAMSGQGHMALGASRASASAPSGGNASVAVAGRLRTDALGAIQAATVAQASTFNYFTGVTNPERWGDYSLTVIDPTDDMTMWTIQEYTSATNRWGVRATRLIAPPPATLDCTVPAVVTTTTQDVTITGTSSTGSGFFDPGPDTGGPGFTRLQAGVTGGVNVNSVTFNSPTSVTLNVTVTTNGLKDVTITNPDGQSRTGIGCISVNTIYLDVSITKTDLQTTEVPGTAVTYTIVAANAGTLPVVGATVADTVPAAITGASWTCVGAGGGTCSAAGSNDINDIVDLPIGATATYTLTGTIAANATGSLVNTATVTAAGDANPANDSATDTDTLTPQADLSTTKTDGQGSATPGDVLTYTITAANAGPSPVTGATVTDTLPAGLSGATWTCGGAGGGTCTASGSGSINDSVDLPVGGSVTYTLSAFVGVNATSPLANTVSVSPPGGVTDPTPGNNAATDSDTLAFACNTPIVMVPDGRLSTGSIPAGATRWFAATVTIGRAYSVEFQNATAETAPGTLTAFSGDDGCTGTASLATTDTSVVDPGASPSTARLSFIAAGTQTLFRMRLTNGSGAPVSFRFGWSDLTMYSPAWSTNGSFDSFYSFQNTTTGTVNGTLTLLDTGGVLVGSFPIAVPPGQTTSVNSASLGVTRNRTGTARFTHDGPPGAINAEAVIANFGINPAYVQPVKILTVREAK